MSYLLGFILGLLVATITNRSKQLKKVGPSMFSRVDDDKFDKVKSMLDDVIIELDDIQGGE